MKRKTDNVVVPDEELDRVVARMLEIRAKYPDGGGTLLTKFRDTGKIVVWPAKSKSRRQS